MDRIKKAFYKEYIKSSVMLTYKLRPLCINKYEQQSRRGSGAAARHAGVKEPAKE